MIRTWRSIRVMWPSQTTSCIYGCQLLSIKPAIHELNELIGGKKTLKKIFTDQKFFSFVITRLCESAMCVLYIYAIFDRYCTPSLHEMHPHDFVSIVFGIFKLMLPGISVSIIAFFMLLHSWMNAFAEITRFADRHVWIMWMMSIKLTLCKFYSDWWNSTDWATYYRRWNFVVHNFIHRYFFSLCVYVVIGLSG